MRTVIVPDCHEAIGQLKRLLAQAGPCDRTVFLGDWFDSFHRTRQTTADTIDWLKDNHQRTDCEFLFGNHDLSYAFPGIRELLCSGYSLETAALLSRHSEIWRPFKLLAHVDGWLITHAGVHPEAICVDDIDGCLQRVLIGLENGTAGVAVRAGRARGGFQRKGGVTWLDWEREFEPIPGIKQIVGHTHGKTPRWKGPENVCIDTELRHYAVIENGKLEVVEVV